MFGLGIAGFVITVVLLLMGIALWWKAYHFFSWGADWFMHQEGDRVKRMKEEREGK